MIGINLQVAQLQFHNILASMTFFSVTAPGPFDVMHHLVIPPWDVCTAAIYLLVLGSFMYCNAVHNLVCSPKVDHEL